MAPFQAYLRAYWKFGGIAAKAVSFTTEARTKMISHIS
jgi:hypothetical protein